MSRAFKYFLALALILLAAVARGRDLNEIKRSGKIYVAFTREDMENINYDLAMEFARYMNVELKPVEIEWDEVFMKDGVIPDSLESDPGLIYTPDALKRADILCSTFTILPWRRRLFGFARTLQSAEVLIVHRNARVPDQLDSLAGKSIAYMRGTSFEEHMDKINRDIQSSSGGSIRLVLTGSSEETKQQLLTGAVYGIILDADEALKFIANSKQQYKIAFPISDISKVAWAVEKNNPLIQEVDRFFKTIASNKRLDEIFKDRFDITYTTFLEQLNQNVRRNRYHRDLDEIIASRKLVIGLRDCNFVYHDEGQKQFMHALAEEFADYLGVDLEIVLTPNYGRYWETSEGKVERDSEYTPDWFNYYDLACDIIVPREWHSNKVHTIPVFTLTKSVVARKGTPISSLEDLTGLKGVIERESEFHDLLVRNNVKDLYRDKINRFIPRVLEGKADYTIIHNAQYEVSDHPELEIKLDLGPFDASWALRKDQPMLEAELNSFFSYSRENGLLSILPKALQEETLLHPEKYINSYHEVLLTGELPKEDIFSIFQDSGGTLWFGTNSGAFRYNGREMVVFNHDQGLPGNSVRNIQQDSSGTMYFATPNGIAKFLVDTTIGVLFEGESFNRVFIDSRDYRWFMGNGGVYNESPDGTPRHLNKEPGIMPEKLMVYQMEEDTARDILLMATTEGVFMYSPEDDQATRLTDRECFSLYLDCSDSIWIATQKGLLIAYIPDLLEEGPNAVTHNMNQRLGLPVEIIRDITTNKSGSIWLVSDARILQVSSTDHKSIVYEQEINIKHNKILSFLIDGGNNLWIGFPGGIQRLTNRRGFRNFHPEVFDGYIYSIFEDSQNRVWITSDNGIFYFSDGTLVNFTNQTGFFSTKFCGTLLPDSNILLASNQGLFEVEDSTLKFDTLYSRISYGPESLFVTSRSEIFVLTGINGVIYYFPSLESTPTLLKNRYTANVFHLIELEDGRVVGGNRTGFVVFNGSDFESLVKTPCRVWSLRKEGDIVWVGTDCGIGLVRDDQFNQLELSTFNRDLVIKSILPARNSNYLWLGTDRGFSYFNTSTWDFELTINARVGLTGDEITPGGLFIDQDDLLWIGTYHGISNYDIRAKSNIPYTPVCYIERVYLNGETIEMSDGARFAHDENNFIFEISALSFSDEASMEYEFYLQGTGNKYTSYHRGQEFRAYYKKLPSGKYEFIYKAKGNNNIWGYGEKITFAIRKAWYNTWIFRIGIIVCFIGTTCLLCIIRINTTRTRRNRSKRF